MIDKNNPKKLITFSPRSMDMIEAIQAQTGWSTTTQVVIRGIEELYKNTFKYGTDPLSNPELGVDIQNRATTKVKAKQAIKTAELTLKEAPFELVCTDTLGGVVETNEAGDKVCRFNQYTMKETAEQIVPIMKVSKDIEIFIPSKDLVLASRPELKKKFK